MFERTVELTLECASTDLFQHIAVEFFVNHPPGIRTSSS